MKSLKITFSILFLLVCTCFLPANAASNKTKLPIYQNTIEDISLSYNQALLTGTIKLDNGLTLRIVDYKTRDDNVLKTWHRGDVVTFQPHIKGETLVLSAKTLNKGRGQVEPYLLFDVLKSSKSGLVISEINEDGKFVRLNDNSVWEFTWYNHLSTKKWKLGERVLVYGQGDSNSYEFINLDAPVSENAYSATASFVSH